LAIERDNVNAYIQAATLLNHTFDACIIQHEYGIFGGKSGDYIIDLLCCLTIPVVSNLHTVLATPSSKEHKVLTELICLSSKVTVMTQHAIDILNDVYHAFGEKIALIPHGVPQFDHRQEFAKRNLGLEGKKIMLSFGFLGRSKGFETAIEAVAAVKDPNFCYIILGSTHPNVLRDEGESYRDSLQDKAKTLGISDKILFINRFASEDLLVQYLSACDIYVTPYPNKNQISSGTLSFAIGAGAAVISTPYWYAKDLLANDRGLLFDFRDTNGLAVLINKLLNNPDLLAQYRRNAASYGKHMSWSNVGKMQLQLLHELTATIPPLRPPIPITDVTKKPPLLLAPAHNKLSS
jgi:glycosyltransferase involved in cell wall biosynthesis